MKQKIIAIGGGDLKSNHTLSIDREIVKFSNKKNPILLFIPTASSDNSNYVDIITKYFQDLDCQVNALYLIKEKSTYEEIKAKIMSADIIYVGGGNTLKMMTLWRKLKINELLNEARKNGAVLCGISAGSICWFNYGNSDSRKFKNPNADYIKVTGLGFINAMHCPHYDTESKRKESLKKMMKKNKGIAIAIEDFAALQIENNMYRIISSDDKKNAYKIYWKNNMFYEEIIEKNNTFKPLENLLTN